MNFPLIIYSSSEIHRFMCRNVHTSRQLLATHYDTLQLKRSCSSKEIRESFLKLSKQFHPDKNISSPDNHAQFVKLNEAYSILSKPRSRYNYDLSLWDSTKATSDVHGSSRKFKDKTFWDQRDTSQDRFYQNRAYYGIDGIKKLPNSWIVAFCIGFAVVGIAVQALAISKSVTFKRETLDELSATNSLLHSAARQHAQENGNEVQLELLRKRLSADPTDTPS